MASNPRPRGDSRDAPGAQSGGSNGNGHRFGPFLRQVRVYIRVARHVVLPPGAPLGILIYAALFATSIIIAQSGVSMMGVSDPRAEKVVAENYKQLLIDSQIDIGLAHIVIGFVIGALVDLFWRLIYIHRGRPRRRVVAFALNVVSIVAVHAIALSASMAKYPQIYADLFYEQGGWPAAWQVFATDTLPYGLYATLTIAAIAAIPALALALALRRGTLVPVWRWLTGRRLRVVVVGGTLAASALGLLVAAMTNEPKPQGPNLLILAADSLRPDALGVGGSKRDTSPAIDALAAQGTFFESAFTSLPRTFPAWVTILTGQWAYNHGIRHMFPTAKERKQAFNTIATEAKGAGYATAVVSDFAGDIFPRVSLGFDRVVAPDFTFPALIKMRSIEIHKNLLPYVTNPLGRSIFPALRGFAHNADPEPVADALLAEIDRARGRSRFFISAFFSTTHFPYAAPYPYYKRYTEPGYRGRFKYHKFANFNRPDPMTDVELAHIRALYDGTVRAVDDQIARVVRGLEARGLKDSTQIVILSDHGENLFEHGRGMGHGDHLRGDPSLRLPFIWVDGAKPTKARRVKAIVRDVDVMPTALARLGLTVPPGVDGVDLSPLIDGRQSDLGLNAFAETGLWFVTETGDFWQRQRIYYPDLFEFSRIDKDNRHEIVIKDEYSGIVRVAKHRMVRTKSAKLIYIPQRRGVTYELYDLAKDPNEQRNVAGDPAYAKLEAELKATLTEWMTREKRVSMRNGFLIPESDERDADATSTQQ